MFVVFIALLSERTLAKPALFQLTDYHYTSSHQKTTQNYLVSLRKGQTFQEQILPEYLCYIWRAL